MKSAILLSSVFLGFSLSAACAGIVDVEKTIEVNADASSVWKEIAYPCSAKKWHPAVTKCTALSKPNAPDRSLTTASGFEFHETDLFVSESSMTMIYNVSYEGSSKPLPLSAYVARITVDPLGAKKSRITWRSRLVPVELPDEQAQALVGNFYALGLKTLAEIVEGISK